MEDKPSSALSNFFKEIKAGNPLIILLVLALLVALSGAWVWQTIRNPVVNTPTPRFRHSTVVSPVKVLTARALTAEASITPVTAPQVTSTPTVVAKPKFVVILDEKINHDE